MELSMSLKPAEFEVQNIEFIEEELLENYRIDSRYSIFQNETGNSATGPNKYSMATLKNSEN